MGSSGTAEYSDARFAPPNDTPERGALLTERGYLFMMNKFAIYIRRAFEERCSRQRRATTKRSSRQRRATQTRSSRQRAVPFKIYDRFFNKAFAFQKNSTSHVPLFLFDV